MKPTPHDARGQLHHRAADHVTRRGADDSRDMDPAALDAAAHASLKDRLFSAFRGRPTPIVMSDHFGTPGASIWSGARLWVNRFREVGLRRGDRVAIAVPPSPIHVMLTIAAWWEGLTAVPTPPGQVPLRQENADGPGASTGATLVIVPRARPGAPRAGLFVTGPDADGVPVHEPTRPWGFASERAFAAPLGPALRWQAEAAREPRTADVSFAGLAERLSLTTTAVADPALDGEMVADGTIDREVLVGPDWTTPEVLLDRVWPALLRGGLICVHSGWTPSLNEPPTPPAPPPPPTSPTSHDPHAPRGPSDPPEPEPARRIDPRPAPFPSRRAA